MKNFILSILLIVAPLAFCAQSPAGYVAPFNVASPVFPDGGEWTFPVVFEDAGFVKLHLKSVVLEEGEKIELFGGEPSSMKIYGIEGPFRGDAWLPSVDGGIAVLTLTSKGGAFLSVDKVGIGFEEHLETGTPERICGNDDRLDPACYDAAKMAAGDKVGRILFEANGTLHYCTGFLVGADGLFATNQHCIYNSETAASAEVRWKYQMTSCGGTSESFDTVSVGTVLVMTDFRTDLTLLRFLNDNPASRYGYATLDNRELKKDEIIWIPQHSAGGPKKFAVHSDSDGGAAILVANLTGVGASQAIGYNLDVEAGSSGSPVLDENNKVVAMHTFTALDEKCESPDLNRGMKMEVLYPLIQPYISACTGTPPEITEIKYSSRDRQVKLRGTGFAENCEILVNGVIQSTKLKKNGKLVAAMYDKLFHGETITISVFDPDTGCSSAEFSYTRP
jgi:hypothetical protein